MANSSAAPSATRRRSRARTKRVRRDRRGAAAASRRSFASSPACSNPTAEASPSQSRPGTQMVFQDAGASLTPWLTIGEQIRERAVAAGMPKNQRNARVDTALERVGLPASIQRKADATVRRSTPASRPRPSDRDPTSDTALRRADKLARRLARRHRTQSDRPTPRRTGDGYAIRNPRPRGRTLRVRSNRSHVPRPDRGNRRPPRRSPKPPSTRTPRHCSPR